MAGTPAGGSLNSVRDDAVDSLRLCVESFCVLALGLNAGRCAFTAVDGEERCWRMSDLPRNAGSGRRCGLAVTCFAVSFYISGTRGDSTHWTYGAHICTLNFFMELIRGGEAVAKRQLFNEY